jgi:hypothetical protein
MTTGICRIAALVLLALGLSIGQGHSATPCQTEALETLRRAVPEGHRIYERLNNKEDFLTWIDCTNLQSALTTAVHEGVHALTSEIDAYPLIDGRKIPRIGESGAYFAPKLIARQFSAGSTFVSTYLKSGGATSADEFGFLLDELNAYTHDLNTAVKLAHLSQPDREIHHRDGLAALMAFVAAYVERARQEDGVTWYQLGASTVRPVVATLWSEAERVMGASCRTKGYANEAPAYLAPVCSADISHGLGGLLGRPPLCPVSCLKRSASLAR